jgi:methionyl-tRNA formyltransferase
MKIIFLGPDKEYQETIIKFLLEQGNIVDRFEDQLNYNSIVEAKYNYIISFGYRHIIRKKILNYFDCKSINLHISYLPWNRGADPNLWSILEDTPKGVTIHQIDEGLDTGKIFCQKEVSFSENETLSSSYKMLCSEIVSLFIKNWSKIESKELKPEKQRGPGSYHKTSDKEEYMGLLDLDWNEKIDKLIGKAKYV